MKKAISILFSLSLIFFVACKKSKPNVVEEQNPPAPLPNNHFSRLNSFTSEILTNISFCDDNNGVICGSFGTFYKTTNGGKTWASLDVGVDHSFLSVQMLNETLMYVARVGLYYSNNSGETFNELGGLSNEAFSIFGIHFFNPNKGIITKGNLILKTENGGTDWSPRQEAQYAIHHLQFPSANVGFAAGGTTFDGASIGEIHKTTDGGNSWVPLDINTSKVNAMYFVNANVGYLYNFHHELLKTTDGGTTWNKISETEDYVMSLVFVDESIGYMTSYEGNIWATTNGGVSWNKVFNVPNIPLVKIIKTPNNTIIAVGNEGTIVKNNN